MAKVIGRQGGTRWMIDAGTGNQPQALAEHVPLAYVYDEADDEMSPKPWPVASLAARGYWEPVGGVPPEAIDRVEAAAATALKRRER